MALSSLTAAYLVDVLEGQQHLVQKIRDLRLNEFVVGVDETLKIGVHPFKDNVDIFALILVGRHEHVENANDVRVFQVVE